MRVQRDGAAAAAQAVREEQDGEAAGPLDRRAIKQSIVRFPDSAVRARLWSLGLDNPTLCQTPI